MFNTNYFLSRLDTNSICKSFEYFDEINSTNTYLLEKEEFRNGDLVLAEFQTAGRGRQQRKWLAMKELNLTFSLGLIPKIQPEYLSRINFTVALAIAETIDEITNFTTEIKWPNDILLNGKKFCGMLIETQFEGLTISKFVIGIGLNILQTDFPDEYKSRTTSLKLFFNKDFSREEILSCFINKFSEIYKFTESDFDKIYKKWLSKCSLLGKEISLSNGIEKFRGIVKNVEQDGTLILNSNGIIHKLNSGDVTIIKKD